MCVCVCLFVCVCVSERERVCVSEKERERVFYVCVFACIDREGNKQLLVQVCAIFKYTLSHSPPDSESASEATSCTSTSAEAMDDSDSSADHKATTTCSPAFIKRKIKRRAAESDFKETKKTKLTGNAAKRFFQRIKQKFTTRKLQRNLKKVEVAPLLSEDSHSGSDGAAPVLNFKNKKKKSKKSKSKHKTVKKKFSPFGRTDTKPLLEEIAQSEECGSEQEGEDEEEEINTEFGLPPREKPPTRKDRMEIEVVSDKKSRQNEARRLRRQRGKVTLVR